MARQWGVLFEVRPHAGAAVLPVLGFQPLLRPLQQQRPEHPRLVAGSLWTSCFYTTTLAPQHVRLNRWSLWWCLSRASCASAGASDVSSGSGFGLRFGSRLSRHVLLPQLAEVCRGTPNPLLRPARPGLRQRPALRR